MDSQSTRSFWKRHGVKVPGSISIDPSHPSTPSTTASSSKPEIVIGARYTYASLVTTNTYHKHHRTSSTASSTARSSPPQPSSTGHRSTPSTSAQPHPPKKHQRKKPHQKSFNAFLKDTNDEWSDDINEVNTMGPITPTQGVSAKDSIQHHPPPPVSVVPLKKEERRRSSTALSTLSATPSSLTSLTASDTTSTTTTTTTTTTSTLQTAKAHSTTPIQKKKKKQSSSPNGIKDHYKELLQDPTKLLDYTDIEETADPLRTQKFKDVLSVSNVDLSALRSLSWSGIPQELRMMAWQLLFGYLPCNSARRGQTLARKRKEYSDSVAVTYARGIAGLDQALWHQIHIDIPRTNPGIPLYQCEATQQCLERILYIWAIRHPASGYVQGINDLVTPIFQVFLSAYIDNDDVDRDIEQYDVGSLDEEVLSVIEADSFWCLSKLLDGIQDNYTFAQPGIQRQIVTLKELVSRIDARLAQHLQNETIEFIQFAFRWMNCLLMRELPLRAIIRMWDTYLAEGSSEGFSEFHVYVCAAFLVKWSPQLQKLDFQGVMIFLQQLPTQGWQEKDVELLLSEAYMWKTLFHNAPSHLK